jgi:hypothetical protein
MFSALGNQTDSALYTSYKSTSIRPIDISFKPIQNPNGNKNYLAVVEKKNETIVIPKQLQISQIETDVVFADADDDDDDEKPNIFSLGNDPIKTFYIGSITAVGLFILYRILTKKG